MKKIIPYLALIPMVALALTPPWAMKLDCTLNSLMWLWLVFSSGFLAFLFLYTKTNVCLKLLILWAYIGCFLSRAPYLSFTLFWSVILCSYYYLLCLNIKDFTPVKKVIQALFFFITLLIIMQCLGLDTLLNFNHKEAIVLGTIGNKQILATYVCVIAPFLIFNPLNWVVLILIVFIAKSAGGVVAILSGLGYYLWRKYKFGKYLCILLIMVGIFFTWSWGKFDVFTSSGRLPVWKKTIELTLKHPQGYGVGCNKILFPVLCGNIPPTAGANQEAWEYDNTHGRGLAWRRTHNCFLQILFETGFIGFFLFLGWIVSIVWKSRHDIMKSTGLVILGMIMIPHFPTRLTQSVLIMLMFLAFCSLSDERQNEISG